MRVLNEIFREKFRRTVAEYLRTEFSVRCAATPAADLLAFVDKGVAKGERFGLEMEADICDYVAFLFEHGMEFETDPKLSWAQTILDDDTLPPAERMSRLTGWVEAFGRAAPH